MRPVNLALSYFSIPPLSNVLAATVNSKVVAYINKVWGDKVLVPLEGDQIIFFVVTFIISIHARFILECDCG